jgi:two-component system cell cycle response regulator
MQAIRDALADLTEGRVQTVSQLQTAVNLLELAPYRDVAAAVEPARVAAELAVELGDEQIQAQVQLVQADIMAREGRTAESGQLLFTTNTWAQVAGNAHVQARSHYLMSNFHRLMGDLPFALEHALYALQAIPKDVLPELRAEHLLIVALAFDDSGNAEEAAWRYEEVASIGLRIGHPRLAINALNNMAYVCCEEDRPYDAVPLIARMSKIADDYGIELTPRHLDTAATVEVMLGSPDVALRMLAPVITPALGVSPPEPESLAQCLLTSASALRALGSLTEAQQTLARLTRFCQDQKLESMAVLARLEQARLYADGHDYRRAYEEHIAFHAAGEALRSAEREARARILQVTLGAQETREDVAQLRELAMRDPLTGLHNRRFVNERLAELLERCNRLGEVLSVAMLDLDHFKRINDTLSHTAGDAVLVEFGKLLSDATEKPLLVARLGGEEFLAILPDTAEDAATDWARSMLERIRAHDWSSMAGDLPVTASVGLSTVRGATATQEGLLATADENLYVAKRTGRDRFVGAGSILAPHEVDEVS